MKVYPFCDPYFWENPKVMLQTGFSWRRRKEGPCASEIINHIFFVYLLAFIVGAPIVLALGTQIPMLILLALATAYALPSFWALLSIRSSCGEEGFQSPPAEQKPDLPVAPKGDVPDGFYDVIGSGAAPASLTLPTARNPFMNVLIDEIKYKPKRPVAAAINDPDIKVSLDDYFRTEFYADPTDVFGKSQSQRQFVAQPSTGIPNDQGSYQTWLYGIAGKTCKEGGREACLPGTDGGQLPWLNADS